MDTYDVVGVLQRVPFLSMIRGQYCFGVRNSECPIGLPNDHKGLIVSQESLRWQESKGHYDSETHAPKDMPSLGCPEGDL